MTLLLASNSVSLIAGPTLATLQASTTSIWDYARHLKMASEVGMLAARLC